MRAYVKCADLFDDHAGAAFLDGWRGSIGAYRALAGATPFQRAGGSFGP